MHTTSRGTHEEQQAANGAERSMGAMREYLISSPHGKKYGMRNSRRITRGGNHTPPESTPPPQTHIPQAKGHKRSRRWYAHTRWLKQRKVWRGSKSPKPPPQKQRGMDGSTMNRLRKYPTRAAAKGDTNGPPRQGAHRPSNPHENHSPVPLYRHQVGRKHGMPSTPKRRGYRTPPGTTENTQRAREHTKDKRLPSPRNEAWYECTPPPQNTPTMYLNTRRARGMPGPRCPHTRKYGQRKV